MSHGYSFPIVPQHNTVMTINPVVDFARRNWLTKLIYEWKYNENNEQKRCGPEMTGSWSTCL